MLEAIGIWIEENIILSITIVLMLVVIYFMNKKKKVKKEIKEEAPKGNNLTTFDTAYLEHGLLKANFVNGSELGILRERRINLKAELNKDIETYNNAKKRYEELGDIGKGLLVNIKTLQKELNYYNEQINILEDKESKG